MKVVLANVIMKVADLSKSKYSSNAIENCIMKDSTWKFVDHFMNLINDTAILKGKLKFYLILRTHL